MANIMRLLPAGPYDPLPDPTTLAMNLVKLGIHISSSAFSSALRPLPSAVSMSDNIHFRYAFSVALLLIFFFGVGMIWIGWKVADDSTRYSALGRAIMRASHVVLVFVIALREIAARSASLANNRKK